MRKLELREVKREFLGDKYFCYELAYDESLYSHYSSNNYTTKEDALGVAYDDVKNLVKEAHENDYELRIIFTTREDKTVNR